MHRRTFLRIVSGSTLVSATAGCLFGTAGDNGLELTEVDSLADHVAAQPSEFTDEQRSVVDAALPDGEYVTYGHRPFPDGSYLEVDGEFYRADVAETGTKRTSRTVLGAEEVDDAPDAVPVEEYPDRDREPVVVACRLSMVRGRESDRANPPPDRYVYVFRTVSEDDTALLPAPRHEVVEYEGRTFQLWTEERELDEAEYATALSRVASSAGEFERRVEAEYVVDLDEYELTEDQRAIVETAIEEGEYRERGRSSDAFDDLIDLLREEQPRGDSLIESEGRYYAWTYWHSD